MHLPGDHSVRQEGGGLTDKQMRLFQRKREDAEHDMKFQVFIFKVDMLLFAFSLMLTVGSALAGAVGLTSSTVYPPISFASSW